MATKKIKFERLEKKNLNVFLNILNEAEWKEITQRDRKVPRSFAQTRKLIRDTFGTEGKRPIKTIRPEIYRPAMSRRSYKNSTPLLSVRRGLITRKFEECHEELYSRIFLGLSNPYLTTKQLGILEADIDDATPEFENSHETEHFILRWTNNSDHAPDNISDSTIIEETGEYLETAWGVYESTFGRTPYLPEGASKVEIIFQDIAAIGIASPANGPIQFDSATWVSSPGVRQPTSAHELFHKLQYAFGYRTKHTPSGNYKWFSEGTASWAEVFVWQRVSGAYKILDLFSNPDLDLYSASYRALPYWIFFESRQKDSSSDNAIVDLLNKYESLDSSSIYPERTAYAEVIDEDWPENNVYGQADHLFALFSRDRRLGHWKIGPSGILYPTILGPDDNEVEPTLTVTEVNLGSGDTYDNAGTVGGFASDYYRLVFEPETDGQTLDISVDGASSGDFSFYLIWEKNGNWKRAAFPFFLEEDYGSSYTLDIPEANSLILIISGRGIGGSYSLAASVS